MYDISYAYVYVGNTRTTPVAPQRIPSAVHALGCAVARTACGGEASGMAGTWLVRPTDTRHVPGVAAAAAARVCVCARVGVCVRARACVCACVCARALARSPAAEPPPSRRASNGIVLQTCMHVP